MALMMAACASIARTSQHGAPKVSPTAQVLPRIRLPLFVDLDGDFRADSISLISNGFDKTIRIKFGNLRNGELNFVGKSPDAGNLVAYDINHDGHPDLIWDSGLGQKTAVVLINDGTGNFTPVKDNSPYASEISALLGTDDPSDQYFLRGERQAQILTTSSSSDIELVANRQLSVAKDHQPYFQDFGICAKKSIVLTYLRKRGPPLLVS
jgi:hypothetical protein